MPTYEYRCPEGHEFEKFFRTISGAPASVNCPTCGVLAVRQLSGGAGLLFKGSGFYLTDYGKNAHANKGPKPAAAEGTKGDSAGGAGESKGSGESSSTGAANASGSGQNSGSSGAAASGSSGSASGGTSSGSSSGGTSSGGTSSGGSSSSGGSGGSSSGTGSTGGSSKKAKE
jgi:putative FmdB family regulatory protein